MIELKRICIPLGMDCNFRCKYCYRNLSYGEMPTELSPLMREYLQTVDSEWCQCICMSGGEPLMYMDKIYEIFSLVKPDVHRKIMTNGSLLTQEIVDYLNKNKIELWLSYDGPETKNLRGRDVLDEPEILDLVKQINILSVGCVITNKNCDIMKNYEYVVEKLGRSNLFFFPSPVYFNGCNHELINGFDYDTFERSFREYHKYVFITRRYYTIRTIRPTNFNVTLDGRIVDKNTLETYGTILDTREDCVIRRNEKYKDSFCNKAGCPVYNVCCAIMEQADDHFCRCSRIVGGYV